ncbi:HD domain-containing protein [Humisphaera borealis]|uniref:HD domain-containing protein n=1 Tax=Humisphaera borealis TaxID=2807512 RepID=A0A7M2WXK3_9BACT|nr:HD domain-containing protein [Humisphaera borealis]QOV89932.1 HD domain-containing protein [Humisphaera borealis]
MAELETAIRIAVTAHAGQTDKSGAPYITHPLRLMSMVESDEAKCAAVLHDVVEDTPVTLADLRREGLSDAVLEAVACLTHAKEQPYVDYVIRCKANPIARQVKIADLIDNSRPERAMLRPAMIDRDLARIARYLLSHRFLSNGITEAEYRSLMQSHGDVEAHPFRESP